RE
ncbi:hypothetical protein VCHC55C2_1329B, partial [Vibrio cholerae HC-55C2]